MNKVTNLIQLAYRAGKVAKGDSLLVSIQKSQAKLVLVSSLCGQNRMKKIQDKCTYYNVPYIVVEPSVLDDVSYKKMSAIAIVDNGFAKAIIEKMIGLVIRWLITTRIKTISNQIETGIRVRISLMHLKRRKQ